MGQQVQKDQSAGASNIPVIKDQCSDCQKLYDMYCFERQEFFCAKCDFKQHNQKHTKCDGDVNKDINEIKEAAIKATMIFQQEQQKLKYKTKTLFDYKEYAIKLHILEAFTRVAIFHFPSLSNLKKISQCNNTDNQNTKEQQQQQIEQQDYQYLNLLLNTPKNFNFTDQINNLFKVKDIQQLWRLHQLVIMQYTELVKYLMIISDEVLSPQVKTRHEIIKAICQKIRAEQHDFQCQVSGVVYRGPLTVSAWKKVFNLYFHYIFLQDTYLFFPQEVSKIKLTDLQKMEYVSLQILQKDQNVQLDEMYNFKDQDSDHLQMFSSFQNSIDVLLKDQRSIMPYFIEGMVQVYLRYDMKFKDIESRFSQSYTVKNTKLKCLELIQNMSARLHSCIELQLITTDKLLNNQFTVDIQIKFIEKIKSHIDEYLQIQDNEELVAFIINKSHKLEQKYLYEELENILTIEDYLEEKQKVDKISQLSMQEFQRKFFMQIVYEIKKGLPIDQDFDVSGSTDGNDWLSYQPLRRLNEHTWYEGQWSNTMGQQFGVGMILMVHLDKLINKRDVYIGHFEQAKELEYADVTHTEMNESLFDERQVTEEQYHYAESIATERQHIQDIIPQEDHILNGMGIYISHDGTIYQGEWKNDQKDGYGEFEWPEGSSYKGNWKNDIMFGDGVYTNKHGLEFRGIWCDYKLVSKVLEAVQRVSQLDAKAATTTENEVTVKIEIKRAIEILLLDEIESIHNLESQLMIEDDYQGEDQENQSEKNEPNQIQETKVVTLN
ncbi:morn repeat protein [Stylonychia lemnae]|uniref:Morn repeat protein n=1 Tax=Stylonychia lemnae TaxID=5949 RepID=A0A078AHC8_STYLE|nr:morn repeat protein [Stylonychia lemnae]|eukprot:CDW80897.1 morn repeat protein [Stylonychia lemnae]